MGSRLSKIIIWFQKEKFTFLLFSLFLYTLAAPFFAPLLHQGVFARIAFLIVLLTAVFAVAPEKKYRWLMLTIALLCALVLGIKIVLKNDDILLLDTLVRVIFSGCLIVIITGYFYQCHRVTRDIISAALIGYILLTMMWSNLYILIELIYPNSFSVSHDTLMADASIFRYFSFVTITTLGYGDISPVTSQARNLTVLEAFAGQMYLAVLIARLVAIHTSQTNDRHNHSRHEKIQKE